MPISALEAEYTQTRRSHWERVASDFPPQRSWGGYYHQRLEEIYRFIIPPGRRVLELGCGRGDLLASLAPAHGVGVDFASAMIEQARARHPQLEWICQDVNHLQIQGPFDYIVASDLLNDVWDVEGVLRKLLPLCHEHTRLVLNFHSNLWQYPLETARRMRLAAPVLPQNWLAREDVTNLFHLGNFELLRTWQEVLFPLRLPGLTGLFNRWLVKLPLFRQAALTNFMIARPAACEFPRPTPKVSVVVPARNEAGNIESIFQRMPRLGSSTQLVFVEGNSTDDTYSAIQQAIAHHPEWECLLLKQTGRGKGDAVRAGFDAADGDVLMILDADLTVAPETLPRFVDALCSHKGEFINGVRLVYPMQREAMRFANLIGNKFFGLAFSWILGQSIKDTLCGTKVLWREHYRLIQANRSYFGDFDPFGDFDLLFGAAKQNLHIIDMPVRYAERTYGSTNISRWRHGMLLLRMVLFAARRLKFV